MSRMPAMLMCSVRGMGVAERVSTSTRVFMCWMLSLWLTPKRCSSSTMSRPRSLNCTSLLSRRCVPTTRSNSPSRSLRAISRCSLGVRKRLSMSNFTGKPAKRFLMVL